MNIFGYFYIYYTLYIFLVNNFSNVPKYYIQAKNDRYIDIKWDYLKTCKKQKSLKRIL